MLRAQLALTGAQILFWAALIGAPVALALRARQRRTRREVPTSDDAPALVNWGCGVRHFESRFAETG
ncbi:hypothetical protein A5641_18850 [Mycobacterium sp. 1554424.7]|nr:hypothetical protein A5641_18850 [Mycobacterium sp. 1554424.7]